MGFNSGFKGLSNLLLAQRRFVLYYSICFIERQLVNAYRILRSTYILQIPPHQMRFYNNRCKVPPFIPPNPVSPKCRYLVSTYPLSVLLLWTYRINRWVLNKTRVFAGEGGKHHQVYQCGATSLKFLISNIFFFAVFWMLYAFFWVIPWRLNFICRRFGTFCLFHLHKRIGMKNSSYLSAYEDVKECSETSAYKIQRPGNYPEEGIQHSLKCFNTYLIVIALFIFNP